MGKRNVAWQLETYCRQKKVYKFRDYQIQGKISSTGRLSCRNCSLEIKKLSLSLSSLLQIVWTYTYKTNLRHLVTLQKRVVIIISKSAFDAHTDPIFKEFGLLPYEKCQLSTFPCVEQTFDNFLLTSKVLNMSTR